MKLNLWSHIFRETGRNLWRNFWMTLASVSTVAISLFVFSFFLAVTVNINHITGVLAGQVEMRVFVNANATRANEQALLAKAKQWPQIRKIQFFTKAQAADSLKKQFPQQNELFALIKQSNPLYDGYDVYTYRPDQISAVAQQFRQQAIVQSVVYQGQVANRLQKLTQAVRWVGYGLEVVLSLATLFIIINTIRLAVFARRREIEVMKLVGATDWFIRWPFVLEGLCLGVVGAAVADLALNYGYSWVQKASAVALPFLPLASLHTVMTQVLEDTLIGGMVIGSLGSMVAVRRFLRI